jgi:hypothetical protein
MINRTCNRGANKSNRPNWNPSFLSREQLTRDILVSEVGGSDHIGFFSSGYDHYYMTTGVRGGTDWIRLIRLLEL